jgi:hypothetical protein
MIGIIAAALLVLALHRKSSSLKRATGIIAGYSQ